MATGDIIVMLPADDCFKPGAFEQVFKTFSDNVDALGCRLLRDYQ